MSFYVIAEEVTVNGAIQVDQTVRHYDAAGKLLGLARVPVAEQYTYVAQGLAVGPDGAVYALITRPDRVEVWRLRLARALEPILPAASTEKSPRSSEESGSAILACRSRDSMIGVASGYVNNQKYLSSMNLDGDCPGRRRPRYLEGPGTYYSVPYDCGGWDTVSMFNGYMYPNTKQAGDIDCGGAESCSKGTNCSGFVSRCWGLSTHHYTGRYPSLGSVSCQLKRTDCLQRGDIMNSAGNHVVLFRSYASGGINDYESTASYNNYDRVVYTFSPWSRFSSGYVPLRYCNVCTTTCTDSCAIPCP